MSAKKIAVMGSGAWGTALAVMACHLGHEVVIYGRNEAIISSIQNDHVNNVYLQNIILPKTLTATNNAKIALENADYVLGTIPAQAFAKALEDFAPFIPALAPFILCAKGIEQNTGRFMSDIVEDVLPNHPLAALSGPSFADDVARGLPTAVTIAAKNIDIAKNIAHILSGPNFRCYANDDVMGVEIGGALKNVLALAAGAAEGRGLGASAKAALITRGFAELRRIAKAFGARESTMTGLAVLGDLLLTCSSTQSRNYSYGFALGKGLPLENLKLAEGVATAPIAAKICQDKKIDAPIITAIAALLDSKISIDYAIQNLITRPLKTED